MVSEVAPVVRRPRHTRLRFRSREVRVFLLDIAAAATTAASCIGATERGEELCEERLAHGRPRVGEAAEEALPAPPPASRGCNPRIFSMRRRLVVLLYIVLAFSCMPKISGLSTAGRESR